MIKIKNPSDQKCLFSVQTLHRYKISSRRAQCVCCHSLIPTIEPSSYSHHDNPQSTLLEDNRRKAWIICHSATEIMLNSCVVWICFSQNIILYDRHKSLLGSGTFLEKIGLLKHLCLQVVSDYDSVINAVVSLKYLLISQQVFFPERKVFRRGWGVNNVRNTSHGPQDSSFETAWGYVELFAFGSFGTNNLIGF